MPEYTGECEIEVSVQEFYDDMNTHEKQEMCDLLREDDYDISYVPIMINQKPKNIIENIFQEKIEKILLNRFKLTSEEEELITKIANRL